MSQSKMKIRSTDSTFRALAALLLCPAPLCGYLPTLLAMEPNDTKVEIKLEGQFIERIVLMNKDGKAEAFEDPARTIKLAPGKYHVNEVRLQGGCSYYFLPLPDYIPIEIDTNDTSVLKVGGPLHQVLDIRRQGGILVLDRHLLGIGGEKYRGTGAPPHPEFAVYIGDKKIKSGQFEYG